MKFMISRKTVAVLCLVTLSIAPALCGAQGTAQKQEITKFEKIKQGIKNSTQSALRFVRAHWVAFGAGTAACLATGIAMRILFRAQAGKPQEQKVINFEELAASVKAAQEAKKAAQEAKKAAQVSKVS